MKNKLLLLSMGFALTTQIVIAQVPSYVPTNSLVGYWPFNGNANDESGNGNNGTVNGATLTTDRQGNNNSAYNFDGNSFIQIDNWNSITGNTHFTVSFWTNPNQNNNGWALAFGSSENGKAFCAGNWHWGGENFGAQIWKYDYISNALTTTNFNTWSNIIIVYQNNTINAYKNGVLVATQVVNYVATSLSQGVLNFGKQISFNEFYSGSLDDIGIWNSALTQQEITNLYNSANTNECLTMTINTGVLSTTPVTYTSTVNIYPNPANDQITIDCGNLANVVGWNIKITNMLGQEVFNQPMNTQQYVVPLNSWSGQGMYFVKIINAQNEVVNIKKIILQ